MTKAIAQHSPSHIKMAFITLCGVAALLSCAPLVAQAQSFGTSQSQGGGGGGDSVYGSSGSSSMSPSSKDSEESEIKGLKKRLEEVKTRLATLEAKENKTAANLAAIDRLKNTTIPSLKAKIEMLKTNSSSGDSNSGSGSGSGFGMGGAGAFGGQSADSLMKRIAQLEEMQNRLKNILSGVSSTTPRGPARPTCPPSTSASTSNASARCNTAHASSSITVLYPNNGTVVRNKKDGAVLVMWKHRGVESVDIVLKRAGSSTIDVASDLPAGNVMHANIAGYSSSTGTSSIMKSKKGVGRYLYKNAPIGKNFTIEITGQKIGGGTVTDASNKSFAIVDAKTAAEWTKKMNAEAKKVNAEVDGGTSSTNDEEYGNVLGASTSLTDEYVAVLDGLEEVLAGFAQELAS